MSDTKDETIATQAIGLTDLRQPAKIIDRLKASPFVPISLERYGSREAVIASEPMWNTIMAIYRGDARTLKVDPPTSTPGAPPKGVVVRPHPITDAPFQRFTVHIDWMPYELSASSRRPTPCPPDYSQLIWIHHPEVAQAVCAAFPWTTEHDREQREIDRWIYSGQPTQAATEFARACLEDLEITGSEFMLPDPHDSKHYPDRVSDSIAGLINGVAEVIQDCFDSTVMMAGGEPMGEIEEEPDRIAARLIHEKWADEITSHGWNIQDLLDRM